MTDETTEIETIETPPEPAKPDVKDIDASWNGTGSLDDHRQKCFEKLKQPGFGREGMKSNGK